MIGTELILFLAGPFAGNNIIILLVVGAIAGWLAGNVMRGGGFGLVGDIVVGIIGAFLGAWIFSQLGVSAGGGIVGLLITAFVGAVVLLLLIRLIKRA
ncbi:MAG: GlsB/YeaQ/YmgE family stress response membrane protein [Acidobacteriota bacterium]